MKIRSLKGKWVIYIFQNPCWELQLSMMKLFKHAAISALLLHFAQNTAKFNALIVLKIIIAAGEIMTALLMNAAIS